MTFTFGEMRKRESAQKPPGHLFQLFVLRTLGLHENLLDVLAEARFTPVVSGGQFGELEAKIAPARTSS